MGKLNFEEKDCGNGGEVQKARDLSNPVGER